MFNPNTNIKHSNISSPAGTTKDECISNKQQQSLIQKILGSAMDPQQINAEAVPGFRADHVKVTADGVRGRCP